MNMEIKEQVVTRYVINDESSFADKKTAIKHEALMELKKSLKEILENLKDAHKTSISFDDEYFDEIILLFLDKAKEISDPLNWYLSKNK